jgi:hypothetical protein
MESAEEYTVDDPDEAEALNRAWERWVNQGDTSLTAKNHHGAGGHDFAFAQRAAFLARRQTEVLAEASVSANKKRSRQGAHGEGPDAVSAAFRRFQASMHPVPKSADASREQDPVAAALGRFQASMCTERAGASPLYDEAEGPREEGLPEGSVPEAGEHNLYAAMVLTSVW